MIKVKVGLRRLYDAMGCAISSQEEIKVTFPVDKFTAIVYIGPNPVFGVAYNPLQNPKYQVPGEVTRMAAFEYQKDASQSTYPRKFFTEITVLEEVEVDEDVAASFLTGDSQAANLVLNKAAQDEFSLRNIIDVVAGTIGLRFHCQYVMEIISETLIALKTDDDWGFRFTSPAIQLLESIAINSTGVQSLNQLLPSIGQTSSKVLNHGAKAMG